MFVLFIEHELNRRYVRLCSVKKTSRAEPNAPSRCSARLGSARGAHSVKKVQKIVDWPAPRTLKQARGFLGLVAYYRIFIQDFSTIAAPIYQLFRKNAIFEWGAEQQSAMDRLKTVITTAPVLVSVDFSPSALPIILHTDASTTIGWGAILSQLQSDGNLHPARYESGIWNDIERKYDAVKLECRGLLKALRKFRFWLYGRHFKLETDAQTLVWLLNQPPNDLPNAMITRWLTYIRLFDFDVKHVAGNKNGGADALSDRKSTRLNSSHVRIS